MARTKLFKIGECAYYGKWRITIRPDEIITEGLDFYKNTLEERHVFERNELYTLHQHLINISTCFWGDTMMEWVYKTLGIKK